MSFKTFIFICMTIMLITFCYKCVKDNYEVVGVNSHVYVLNKLNGNLNIKY